jgi:hypothetical protein
MNARWLVLASLLFAACGSTEDSTSPPADSGADGTADTSGTDTGVAAETSAETSTDAPLADVGCPKCLSTELSWGQDGGEVAWIDRSTLKGCDDYHRARTGSTTLACDAKIPTCPGDVPDSDFVTGVADIESALSSADVQAALAKAPVLYGTDSRPVDGQVFQVLVGSKKIEVGGACGGASGCTEIPAGVAQLRDVLQRIDAEKKKTACSAF